MDIIKGSDALHDRLQPPIEWQFRPDALMGGDDNRPSVRRARGE
jgi:hypothetical protein